MKMDLLDSFDEIQIGVAYKRSGKVLGLLSGYTIPLTHTQYSFQVFSLV